MTDFSFIILHLFFIKLSSILHVHNRIFIKKIKVMTNKVPFIPDKNQVEQMIQQVTFPKYRFMIRFMYELAIRVGELVAIQKADINLQNATIKIRGKGSKQRLLPLTQKQVYQVRCFMAVYPTNVYLLESNKCQPYSTRGVRNIVYDACGNTFGHFLIHPHSLRHSRATGLVNSHVGLWHVQQLLGHSSLQTTSVYLHYAVDDLRSVLSK